MSFIDNSFEIYLNSSINKYSNDTSANWTTQFTSINLDPNEIYEVGVSSAQIPNTAPQFHNEETLFTVIQNGTTYNFTYDNSLIFDTIQDLLTYVNTLFNSSLSNITISQDTSTRKTKIVNSDVNNIQLIKSPFFDKIGFKFDNNQLEIEANETVLSSYYPTLINTSRYYIVCEEIMNNSFSGVNYNNWSIFLSVNVNSGFGSFCNYSTNNNIYFHQLGNTGSINNLSFRILDDKFRQVDLNNQGVQLSLILKKSTRT